MEKALIILECFTSNKNELTLDDFSKLTGYSKSTVFRMISSLEKFGYIKAKVTNSETRYSLGLAFLEKANLVSNQLDIRELAKDEIVKLRNKTNMTVQLAIRHGNEAIYIEQAESFRELRIFPGIGKRVPLYAAACPRILLAFLDVQEREQILDSFHYVPFTSNTLINPTHLRESIERIRERGYEISEGEIYEGTIAIAAPIMDRRGEVIASLSITGMKTDFEKEIFDSTINEVIQSAKNISYQLGYPGSDEHVVK
ncbi:IclR family transcriptional regulator [Bacillus sp. Marseille-Q3570]|uniref:IclR family transcriptional regulator n=1 Tax=Bacillus sp. Marseille-Q3570 TaxID=2963522 RepID=UPI0021B83C15|nr:IclR family transcriptional regulator [Bacillus sp. Marseille-Q3570]